MVLAAGQANPRQCLFGPRSAFLHRHVGVHQRQCHVVESAGARDELEALEHEAKGRKAQRREIALLQGRDLAPLEEIAAAGGLVETAEQIHQRRFPGARGPHDRKHLDLLDRQVHVHQGVYLDLASLVGLADARQPDDRLSCHGQRLR